MVGHGGEVVPARTSPTLHPPSLPTVHQLSRLVLKELKSTCIYEYKIHFHSSFPPPPKYPWPASYCIISFRAWTDHTAPESLATLTLNVLVATIDAQWEGMGDVGSARYEPALLQPCPTIRVLSYSS